MKKRILQLAALTTGVGLVLGISGCCGIVRSCLQQVLIVSQPQSQTVPYGWDATFSVKALIGPPYTTTGLTYQWQFNPVVLMATNVDLYFTNLPGATSPSITITNADPTNGIVGFYRVVVSGGGTNVTSDPAALQVFTHGSPITVHGTPIARSASGSCPGSFNAYIPYTNTPPKWGWTVINSGLAVTATDGITPFAGNRIQMVGWYDANCAANTVSINPPLSPKYEFTIYFNSIPPGNYPLVLTNLQ